jgi:hypothetical protein
MTGFGPGNFQQTPQQRSQRFHQEASQRAMEMHQQARQRAQEMQQQAQQAAKRLQRLQDIQRQQHQQWQRNQERAYWAERQRRLRLGQQQSQELGTPRNTPFHQVGQQGRQATVHHQYRPTLASTSPQPRLLAPVEKERGGCTQALGLVFLLLFLSICVSLAVATLL